MSDVITSGEAFQFLGDFEKTLIQFTNAMYHDGIIDLIGKEEFRDMLSSGQLMSKKWLSDNALKIISHSHFSKAESHVKGVVVGGWNGFLAQLLINRFGYHISVDSLDISETATRIAAAVMSGSLGKAIRGDMYDFDYAPYQLVVNTSAEHIPDVSAWSNLIPKGASVIVQSNNARHIKEHISCVDSAEELLEKLNLRRVNYTGAFEFPMYTRFMVIGQK